MVLSNEFVEASHSTVCPPRVSPAVSFREDKSILMMGCLFAMLFAAAGVGILGFLGVFTPRESACPVEGPYGKCDVTQDIRTCLTFMLAAIMCCFLSRRDNVAEEELSTTESDLCFDSVKPLLQVVACLW